MTFADHLFHNIYICEEIFSHAGVGHRYCELKVGNLIANEGLIKLLQFNANFENDLYFTKGAMDLAAMNGHLETVQWLHTNREEGCSSLALVWAAEGGHLHVVQWLFANHNADGIDLDKVAMLHAWYAATNNGNLSVAQWLRENE